MKRQFSLGTVFRMAEKPLLRRFFGQFGAEVETFCWDDVNYRNVQPLEKLFDSLQPGKRDEAEVALRQIHALACDKGMGELAESAAFFQPGDSWEEMFLSTQNLYSKSFSAWLDFRDVFDYAVQFFEVDSLAWWQKRLDLPRITPHLDGNAIEALETEIEDLLKTTQGRGYACTIETVSRANGVFYFFAYPDDYVRDSLMHDDTGVLVHRPIRQTFEIVFAYDSIEGSSDLSARLPKRIKEQLELIFLRNILNMKMTSEEQKPFDLSVLLAPNFQLATRPEDHLKANVTGIAVSLSNGDSVSFRTQGTRPAVQAMRAKLDPGALLDQNFTVSWAKFRFEFLPAGGGRPKRLTFEISAPFSSTLKNRRPDLEEIIHRYLKDWGIEYDHENVTTSRGVTNDALLLTGGDGRSEGITAQTPEHSGVA